MYEGRKHTHTVFDLGKLSPETVVRKRHVSSDVKLVGSVEDPLSEALFTFVTEVRYLTNHLSALVGCKKLKGIKTLAVSGKSGGNNRHAVKRGIEFRKLPHGIVKLVPVVHGFAKNNLSAKLDSRVGKYTKVFEHLTCPLILHHLHAKLGICRVDRHVDGRDVHLDDAVYILTGKIGQRDIVAVEE